MSLLSIARRLTDPIVWLNGDDGMVATGEVARIEVATGPDRFRRASEELQRVFASLGRRAFAFGSFTFDAGSPGSVLVVPQVVWGRTAGVDWVEAPDGDPESFLQTRPRPPADRVRYAGSTISEVAWLDAVARAVGAIERGDVEKVVLARDVLVWSEQPFDLPLLLERLSTRFPGCFTFSCEGLVGATPELLVARSGDDARSVVLAGSVARGSGPAEDASLAAGLMRSEKDLAEHAFAVDSVTGPLSEACADLKVEGPLLLQLANVQHISTRVHGRIEGPATALDLAGSLHPTAAVGGTPRERALAVIRALEGMDRGRYSGPVGWVDSNGDGEWGIALRCGRFDGARGRLFAGNGIVAGSEPEAELEETRLKLRAMMSALEGA